MFLKAKHHAILYPFFKWYARNKIRRHFGKVHIDSTLQDKNLPILLISNHLSWWDGFWAEYVNQKLFGRRFHFMMREDQLRKYWFFNYTGGYSVCKGSRSIIQSLEYTAELLRQPSNLVLLFPQGEIQSMHTQHLVFQSGIQRILTHQPNSIQIVFLANLVDYFSSPKPGIYFYVQEYSGGSLDVQSIERSYNQFYSEAIDKQMKQAVQQ